MNHNIRLPKVPILQGRYDFVISMCKNKTVLHLGCADAGLSNIRYQKQELLHDRLKEVSSELWGVDIDNKGIGYLKELGFDHLIHADACLIDEIDELREINFDVILATELIEHLRNPGMFLDAVNKLMIPGITQLIITVPNAFRIKTILGMFSGIENIHPDHNFWFSYRTIKNLVEKSSFQIKNIFVYTFFSRRIIPGTIDLDNLPNKNLDPTNSTRTAEPKHNILKHSLFIIRSLPLQLLAGYLYRRNPFWGDGLILVCIAP